MASGSYDDLRPRLIVAAVLATVSIGFLAWGGFAFAGLVAAGIFLMTQELLHIVRRDWDVPAFGAIAMGVCGGAAVLATGWMMWLVVIFVTLGLMLGAFAARQSPNMLPILGFVLIVLAGVAVVHLRFQAGGFVLVLWLILCVVAADVGGYFFGRQFGGPKFWPAVSPKKTWSGVLGGLFLALLVAVGFALATSGNITAFMAYGALVAIVSVAGDLLESAVKRKYGVKDAGSMLPGHGGLLDRFDGMTAVMVVFLALSQTIDLENALGVDYKPPLVTGSGL